MHSSVIDSFIHLLSEALPSSYPVAKLLPKEKSDLPLPNFIKDTLSNLLSDSDIDWSQYLRNYPDVEAAGIDPAIHFAQNGIWEKRKLYVKSQIVKEPMPCDNDTIKLSIIIVIDEVRAALGTLISNLAAQSLEEIEIIIFYAAWRDDLDITSEKLAITSPNIRILSCKFPLSRLKAQNMMINYACGEYIMFMEPGSLLTPDACATALEAAKKGYDIVSFNAESIVAAANTDIIERRICADAQICQGYEIAHKLYVSNDLPDILWNRIYKANLCRNTFEEIDIDLIDSRSDAYLSLALTLNASTLNHIDKVLGINGIAENNKERSKCMPIPPCGSNESTTHIWQAIFNLLEYKEQHGIIKPIMRQYLCHDVKNWLKLITPEDVSSYFNYMAENYGIINLISYIVTSFLMEWERVANTFNLYSVGYKPLKDIMSIGILLGEIGNGGTEKVVEYMISYFISSGYSVTLFLEKPNINDISVPAGVHIVYIPLEKYNSYNVTKNIYSLDVALRQNKVDVMFCESCWDEALLWQTMLLKYYHIPVIMHNHMAFFDRLLVPAAYDLQAHDSVLRCADKVLCLSNYSELYNHIQGIDAQCVPNPIEYIEYRQAPFDERNNNIVIVGRIGDATKRLPDALRIIAEVARERPEIVATFVGELRNKSEEMQFYELVNELGIENNVTVTGWVKNPRPIIAKGAVLLSCAYQESFGLAICEAQSLGLPCIIYDIPVLPAQGNASIIRVSHGDIEGAAREILHLLGDEKKWKVLSEIARDNVKRFSPEKFMQKISQILTDLGKHCPVTYHNAEDYRVLLRLLGFYAGDPPPWAHQSPSDNI